MTSPPVVRARPVGCWGTSRDAHINFRDRSATDRPDLRNAGARLPYRFRGTNRLQRRRRRRRRYAPERRQNTTPPPLASERPNESARGGKARRLPDRWRTLLNCGRTAPANYYQQVVRRYAAGGNGGGKKEEEGGSLHARNTRTQMSFAACAPPSLLGDAINMRGALNRV
uniref:Uncharacterized protein n=1 Tax=Plectus sambesii TaxID=2011161 RepID=A0A914VQU5_9BILA